jgi:hypothetical protein
MFYDVIRVVPLPGYRLRLTFDDGSEGELDIRSQISFGHSTVPISEFTLTLLNLPSSKA